jgi:uncharacterized protein (DUF1501 family)
MDSISRRTLLKWSLGAAQLAMLERFGLSARPARAATVDVPSRLVVLYMTGGIRQQYSFWPLDDAAVERAVPYPTEFAGEPVFFRAPSLIDLGPANGAYKPLRVWRSWNPANPAQRDGTYSPAMYGYVHYGLHEQLSMLHGIDQGTNDHASGFVATMCGLAGADFRAPALHSVIANHLYSRFKDTRPLPFVVVNAEGGMPVAMGMPAHAAPNRVPSIDALAATFSDDPAANEWWGGLDERAARPELDARGAATGGTVSTTVLEDFALSRPRHSLGRSTSGVDQFLEGLHGSLSSVSRVLASDVVSVLAATPGAEHIAANPPPHISSYFSPFGYSLGLANFYMTQLDGRFDTVLRLLKSDLTTAVHMSMYLNFDTHSGTGHEFSSAHGRNMMDCIARFLGELKATPAPGLPGKTLLDDTLVLVVSEFGRTWAYQTADGFGLPDAHHPFTSVAFAGGNVAPNRQVGSYTNEGMGLPVDIIEEDGRATNRVPRAADMVTTALRIMGMDVHDFFIPGGFGEVVGMRRG